VKSRLHLSFYYWMSQWDNKRYPTCVARCFHYSS